MNINTLRNAEIFNIISRHNVHVLILRETLIIIMPKLAKLRTLDRDILNDEVSKFLGLRALYSNI